MQQKYGFTLVELAIVIVIIALVAGGIVVSQNLIREANVRAALSEYDIHIKAIKEFQDKYQALPGDMSNAESLWGTDNSPGACPNLAAPTSSANATQLAFATATCNGNGDGRIGSCSGALSSCTAIGEIWRAWQQLAIAGFIDGRYTGRIGVSGKDYRAALGTNVPASKYKGNGWTMMYYLNPAGFAGLDADQYGHILLYGTAQGGNDGKFTTGPGLLVKEAQNVDNKIDDGLPRTGNIRAWLNYWYPDSLPGPSASTVASFCVNGGSNAYDITTGTGDCADTNQLLCVCSMIFIPGF